MRSMPAWVSWSRKGIRLLPRGRYPLMNWLCRRRVEPFNAPLGVTRGRLRFACDLRDGIAREACFMGYYEPQETALVRALLRPCETFVDVGANWGYYTMLAADLVGVRGRVVAFEPHPALFSLLEKNIAANGLSWVTPLRVAIADREGEMNLAGFDEHGENSGVSRLTSEPVASLPNYRVATRRLEPLLDEQGIGAVDLLKMDIEGGEGLVLPTLGEGFARGRFRHVLLELHPSALGEQGIEPRELIKKILSYGYRAWRLDHSAAAFRRAAYKLPNSPREFLAPLDPQSPLDDWPHVLFAAPGVALSW
ncbi:MAG: FkbM family methyltransferase [Acidobacteria bacterium]|nr:FkbM family methyltransferase [Acidobacteriota bacterium]